MTNNLKNIKNKLIPILKQNNIVKASIFGSYARGEETKKSDIDMMIKYKGKMSLLDLIGLEQELQEKTGRPVSPVSGVEETGISQLEDEIKRMFFHGELSFNDEVYITNARHKAAIEESKESLKLVMDSIAMGMSEDFFYIDLMNAYESLGRIVGESVGEDLVNEIFSKFCVGK